MKQKHFIDSHKVLTGPFVLVLIFAFGATANATAWIYLALHGTYGLMWAWKSRVFPDKQWEKPTGIAYGLFIWAGLSLYWVAPWILVTGSREAPPMVLALAVALFGAGTFLHFGSDMQKHIWLENRPGELLQSGLWSRCRNPNYLGELLLYASFAILPLHWAPPIILVAFVLVYWVPKMIEKDTSLSRYPAFAEWKSRSWRFIPGIW